LVLAACHKFGQGDRVRILHEFNKSACVGEGKGRTKAFPNFLCIWTYKEQVLFILYFPQKPFSNNHWKWVLENFITLALAFSFFFGKKLFST